MSGRPEPSPEKRLSSSGSPFVCTCLIFSSRDNPFPAYTIAIAEQLASQFTRFRSLNPHQLAGQVANLDFWSDEVAHCLQVIDEYKQRFNRLKAGHDAYVAAHDTVEFALAEPDLFYAKPLVWRIADAERSAARRALCDAFYYFLVRCHQAGILDKTSARRECERHDIGIDPQDFKSVQRKPGSFLDP